MKHRKRKRIAEDERIGGSDVSVVDETPPDSAQQSAQTTNLPPANISVETLTKIYAEFTAAVKVQQPLLEGNIILFFQFHIDRCL